MADAPDLGSGPVRGGGSSPLSRTILRTFQAAIFHLQRRNERPKNGTAVRKRFLQVVDGTGSDFGETCDFVPFCTVFWSEFSGIENTVECKAGFFLPVRRSLLPSSDRAMYL